MTKRLGYLGEPLRWGAHWAFVRDVGAMSLLRLTGGSLLFASQVLLAGWLGPTAFGIYTFAWAWVAVLGALAAFGLPATAVRFISAYREADSSSRIRGLITFSRAATLGFSLAITAAAMIIAALTVPDSPYHPTLRVALLAVPVLAFLNLDAAFARGFGWMAISTIAEQVGRPLLLIALGWLMVEAFGWRSAPMLAAGCALAYLIATLWQHIVLRMRIAPIVRRGPAEVERGAWLHMASAMFLLNSAQMLRANADPLLVGVLIGPLDLGIYTAAVRTATLVSFVLTITSLVAQPNLSAIHAWQRREELERFFAAATRLTFVLSVTAAALLCIAGPFILRLFGQAFTAGYPTLLILLAGHVAAARFGPVTSLLVMTGHQRTAASIQGVSTLVSALLIVALIAPFGVIGAASAVALSAFATQLALYSAARRRLDVRLQPLQLRGLLRVKAP